MITILPIFWWIAAIISALYEKMKLAIFYLALFLFSFVVFLFVIPEFRGKLPVKNTTTIYDKYTGKPSILLQELDTPWWISPFSIYNSKEIK